MTRNRAGNAQDKSAIRLDLLSRRNSLSVEIRHEYGQVALARITRTAAYVGARFVMAYCSFGSEIETSPLLHTALRHGKELVLPKINPATNELDLYIVEDLLNELVPGVWGIREPNPDLCTQLRPKDLDFIVTPGIAFDKSGGRIGYGRGYYDRLLHACHLAGSRPFTVAAAFEVQIVDVTPKENHDVPIDAIATEIDYYRCGREKRT